MQYMIINFLSAMNATATDDFSDKIDMTGFFVENGSYNYTPLPGNATYSPDGGKKTCISSIALLSGSIVPLLLVIGLFGNIFTIVVMRSNRYKSSSTGIYLTALALSDTTFVLTFPFVKSTTIELFHQDVKALSDAGCKIFYLAFRSAKTCSSWFVVLICIERFIVVWFPLRAKLASNKRFALVSSMCVTVAILAFEGARMVGTSIVNGICLPYYERPETKDVTAALIIASTTIQGILPSIILLSITPLTMIRLFHHYKKRREMTSNTVSDETIRITVMLLTVTVAYIVFVIPISVAHSFAFFQEDNLFVSDDPGTVIFREVAQIFEQLNYVINFFLYIISSASFRSHFFRILECRRDETRAASNIEPSINRQELYY